MGMLADMGTLADIGRGVGHSLHVGLGTLADIGRGVGHSLHVGLGTLADIGWGVGLTSAGVWVTSCMLAWVR